MSEDEPLEILSKKAKKPPKNAVKEKQKPVDDDAPQGKKRGKGKAKEITKAQSKGDDNIESPTINMDPASQHRDQGARSDYNHLAQNNIDTDDHHHNIHG